MFDPDQVLERTGPLFGQKEDPTPLAPTTAVVVDTEPELPRPSAPPLVRDFEHEVELGHFTRCWMLDGKGLRTVAAMATLRGGTLSPEDLERILERDLAAATPEPEAPRARSTTAWPSARARDLAEYLLAALSVAGTVGSPTLRPLALALQDALRGCT